MDGLPWPAAYLHDLGKLAVPLEILEKPDRLNAEFNTIRASAQVEAAKEYIAFRAALI